MSTPSPLGSSVREGAAVVTPGARALARSLVFMLAAAVGAVVASALALALAAAPAHAQEDDATRVFPATEMGGPALPANAVLLKRAGPRGDPHVLRIGVADSGYPPLEIMTTGGQMAGLTADYATLVARGRTSQAWSLRPMARRRHGVWPTASKARRGWLAPLGSRKFPRGWSR